MAAGNFNLTGSYAIERGACHSFTFDVGTSSGEYPLSGYLVSGFLRRKWDKNLEVPNWTGVITSTGSGIVLMSLTAAQTAPLSLAPLEHEIYLYPPNSGCPVRILYADQVDVFGGDML